MSAPITLEDLIALLQKGGENVGELNKQYSDYVEEHTCPLCKKVYKGYGNNPAPLKVKGQVCDNCNATKVIPARLAGMFKK
jgi:hypothetical protein